MPDFLIVGAQKAGTTWLYRNLLLHPQIWMPKEKELHYFDEKIETKHSLMEKLRGGEPYNKRWRRQASRQARRYILYVLIRTLSAATAVRIGGSQRGAKRALQNLRLRYQEEFSLENLEFLKDLAWDLRYFLGAPSDEWYASLFRQGRGKISGESTPDYSILNQNTIARVHKLMPETKIIFMMRSPIERPWSVLDMSFRVQGQGMKDVPDEKLYARLNNKRMRLMTNYLRTLRNWSAFYPEDQIFVGFLEDIHFFPEELLRRLYTFLGTSTSTEYPVIRDRVHSGHQSTILTKHASHLAGVYHEQLQAMSSHFGGYADFWLYCAERLIDDPPMEEHLQYPLWESSLWNEWEGSKEISTQSGPLASVLRDVL